MTKTYKAMKGEHYQKVKEPLKFPVGASTKLDGIRLIIKEGKLLSAKLKEFMNPHLNEIFAELKQHTLDTGHILDGELYSHNLEFNVISGNVRSKYQKIRDEISFHIFDIFILDDDIIHQDTEYQYRWKYLKDWYANTEFNRVKLVNTIIIPNKEELDMFYESRLKQGYEGLIFRQLDSKYKFGRATPKTQDLLKYKPFVDFDGEIIGFVQQQISTAPSIKDEQGKSKKSHKKEFMQDIDRACSFIVRLEDGRICNPAIGQTEKIRDYIWNNKHEFLGRWIEFKAMEVGSKEKPRHPNFKRFRDDLNSCVGIKHLKEDE